MRAREPAPALPGRGGPGRAVRLAWALALSLSLAPILWAQDGMTLDVPGARVFTAQEVLGALAEAYPGRFSPPRKVGSDWGTELDGKLFLWADGRLLPASLAGSASSYAPQPFYAYPLEGPAIKAPSPEERSRMEAILAQRDRNPPSRHPEFLDRLWGASTEAQAWANQKKLRFLGKEILLHRDLLEEVSRVEADIVALADKDAEVAAWADGLGSVSSYYWRDIAGTQSRSYHSYGAAIDLVPKRSGGRAWYWLDARASGLDWMALPASARIKVPKAVIEAFEARGFVWGGKWTFWDSVHFEYRPEILLLNGRRPRVQGSLR